MKNKLSILAISFFIFRASFICISSNGILANYKQNSWFNFLITSIIFFPIILLFYYITKKNIKNKLNIKLNSFYIAIYIFFALVSFALIILTFHNLVDLVNSQYLYKTPKIVISIALVLPIYFLSKTNANSYKITILLLFFFSIFLYIITIIGLIPKLSFENILPFNSSYSIGKNTHIVAFNIIPLFFLLMLCNNTIDKNFIYGYIIGSISLTIMLFIMISVLGIELISLFKYPDYFLLKLAYDGIINVRLQNFLGIQYIIDMIIFISLMIRYFFNTFNIKRKYFLFPIILILTYLFNIYNLKIYNTYINTLENILLFVPFFSLLIVKKENNNSLNTN